MAAASFYEETDVTLLGKEKLLQVLSAVDCQEAITVVEV